MNSTPLMILFATLLTVFQSPLIRSQDYQALTLLAIPTDFGFKYYFPVCIEPPTFIIGKSFKYKIKNLPDNEKHEFKHFCPLLQSQKETLEQGDKAEYVDCLLPNAENRDTCPNPVEPVIKNKPQQDLQPSQSCGTEQEDKILYYFGYQICTQDGNFKMLPFYEVKSIYSICYDHKQKSTVYVKYKIISAHLLGSKSLKTRSDNPSKMSLSNLTYGITKFGDDFKVGESTPYKQYTDLTEMKLAASEDMATDLWEKPTFHRINVKLMYTRFVETWNSIRNYIRGKAKEKFVNLTLYVGTMDELDGIPGIWWIEIMLESSACGALLVYLVMHNVPSDEVVRPLCGDGSFGICRHLNWNFNVHKDLQTYFYCCKPEFKPKGIPVSGRTKLAYAFDADSPFIYSDSESTRNNC